MPKVKCPHCKKEAEYSGNEYRPFCSDRCKLLDFGAWADGNYSLPASSTSLNEEDLSELERLRTEQGAN